MAHNYLTTSDVAVFNKTDMEMVVNDVLDEAPFLAALAARSVPGNSFVYTRKTANPAVGFRAVNDGVETTKATREKVTVSMGVLDASFAVDVAAAESDERGAQHVMAEEAMAHLAQAMREVEEQIINGTVGNIASDAFDGFADMTTVDGLSDDMVVDAGGTTATTGSSVWAVRMGPMDVEALWGQSGVIAIGDQQLIERDGATTGKFPAYYHPITGWVGVKVASTYSIGRIANLTEDAGATLTDDMVSDLLSKFPVGRKPNYLVMNRRSLSQLQQSRTATNDTGRPAPFPSESFGTPIIVTDSISSTETLLS